MSYDGAGLDAYRPGGPPDVAEVAPGETEVTYELTIHHNVPRPGFVRRRVISGLTGNTLTGLRKHLEG